MIVYRCTACTHDHKTLNVQGMGLNEPTCERCGLSSFAQIHLPDEDVELEPPTPRDGPIVLEGAPADDKPKAIPETLRAVEGKPREACSQEGCDETATHRFTWPGSPEQSACPAHAQKAMRVAQAMGFFLEVPAL